MNNIRKARAFRLEKHLKIIEDNDNDELNFIILGSGPQQRRVKWKHDRIDWDKHLEMLRQPLVAPLPPGC